MYVKVIAVPTSVFIEVAVICTSFCGKRQALQTEIFTVS
jgi:hypothetical protein